MEYIHIIVNFFANGKSEMKIYLFLAYFILLFIGFLYSKSYINKKNKNYRKNILVLIFSLFLLNLGSFFYFYKINDIPYLSTIYVYNNNEISSTNILHNHTLKSPIGFILNKVGINPVNEYVDTGYAFTSFFNPLFLYLIILLVSLLIIYIFKYVISSKLNFRQFAILAIISFSLIKNIFDGGFFHTETILALTVFLIILTNKSKYKSEDQQFNLVFFLLHISIVTFIAFISSEFLPLHGYNFLFDFSEKLFLFLFLLTLYYKNQINKIFIILISLSTICIVTYQYFILFQNQIKDKISILSESQKIVYFSEKKLPGILKINSEIIINDKSIITANLNKELSINNLNRELQSKPGFINYEIVDLTCEPSLTKVENFITRVDSDNFDIETDLYKINKNNETLTLINNDCLKINPAIMEEIFYQNNIYKIILIKNGNYTN